MALQTYIFLNLPTNKCFYVYKAMNKLTLVFLILWLYTNYTTAQPFGEAAPDYRILQLVYTNSVGEHAYTNFRYNSQGQMCKAYWALADSTRSSVNSYDYDKQGHLIAAYRIFSDSLTVYERFVYNQNRQKTAEYFYRSDSTQGKAEYSYRKGRLEKAVFKKHKGFLQGEMVYDYKPNGQKEKARLMKNEQQIAQISYTYDAMGNMIEENWDFNGRFQQTFEYHYKSTKLLKHYYSNPFVCRSPHYRVKHEDYTFNNEMNGPSLYLYKDALLVEKKFFRADSLITLTHYQYDQAGRLLSSKRQFTNGRQMLFTYSYNDQDRLCLRQCYENDSLIGFESYTYNDIGELTQAYLHQFDSWLTGHIIFSYDVFGHLKQGEFRSPQGFQAIINFKSSPKGLLTNIRWDFSFNKFQAYTFDYEKI